MKTILITGATDGLGKSVALQLAQEATDYYYMEETLNASMMPTKIVQFPMDDISEGTESVVRLITAKSLDETSGKYFFKKVIQKAGAMAYDAVDRKKLMELAYEMTGL